jgi:hypothetical protein
MSITRKLAETIAAELNQASLSRTFQAERRLDPERELEELCMLRVDVLEGDRKSEAISRCALQGDYRVEIVIRQKGPPEEDLDDFVDQLQGLVEEIDHYFSLPPRRLRLYEAAAWKASELVYPYSIDDLRKKRQFTSLLRLTYQVFEKA